MPNQFNSPEGDLENYFVSEYWLIDQWVGDTLWAWGHNFGGALGGNESIEKSTPVTTFAGGTNWKQVDGGYNNFSAAVKTDGTLWIWGYGPGGELGINRTGFARTPVTTFAGGTDWKQVSCGNAFTAAIKTDGTLWTWGSGNVLGDNTSSQRSTPVTTFAGGNDWKQVSSGRYHIAAIKTDGTLWTWGDGSVLGDNTGITQSIPITTFAGGTDWKQVACSETQTAAIKTDGTLWVWGTNIYGQLGTNDTNTRLTPVTTFAGGNNWKQVARTYRGFTAAIKTDGTLWTWGRNSFGQLGDNTTTRRSTPVTTFAGGNNWKQVSGTGYSISAIKTDGTLWTWGGGSLGKLGTNDAINRTTPVTTFAGGTNWKQVSCGLNKCLAVTSGTDPTFFIS